MDKRLRTNLVLLVIIVALGVFAWLMPGPQPPQPGAALFKAGEAITRIAILRDGEVHAALEKNGEAWRLVAPLVLPADEFQVNALLDALRRPASRRYALDEVTPEKVGLAAPEWTFEINDSRLALGGRTTIGNRRYLRKDDDVFLVSEVLGFRLQRPALDYASKRLLPDGAEINLVQLPSGTRVEKSGTGWRMIPDSPDISADQLQGLIDSWRSAAALKVNGAASVPRDGEVEFEFDNGETLRFGVELRESELLLSRSDPDVTYVLPRSVAESLLYLDGKHPGGNEGGE